ncbi:hypothetical protein [Maribellus mangrovi]|uniref:hypothetical protein n=1 Tax=Maribellus mangrovi TaxID=3133146 RepID=UPI0030EC78A9
MRKIFTLIATLLLSVLAGYAQPNLPEGYVSVYSINSEAEQAPVSIDGGASYQLLGPAQGWGDSTNYDFSNYEKLAFKITYDPADAGSQVAVRFSVNQTGAKLHMFTLPTEGTSAVLEIDLAEYADENGNVLFGGIVFYNGATHWSFSYDGTAATQACTIDYIALKEAPGAIELPEGYVSVYSINSEEEQAPVAIDGGASYQLLGAAAGWGDSTNYDFSEYEKLAFKITYDPADAGSQVAVRFSVNQTGAKLHMFTLPTEGTSTVLEIDLAEYADENGNVLFGGIVFYNGATHWSFSYDGTAATQACTIDYIALKEAPGAIELPEGYVSVYSINSEEEQAPVAIDGGASYQLLGAAAGWGDSTNYDFSDYEKLAFKITYDPADAGSQVAVRFSVNQTGAKLHMFTLPTEGTSTVLEIDLAEYADENGNVLFGGIVFYNGATHWSFSYDGTAATQACTIDYIALKEAPGAIEIPEGYVSVYSINSEEEQAPVTIDGGATYQLLGAAAGWGDSTNYDFSDYEKLAFNITFDPADAGSQMAVRFSVNQTGAKLHMFTLPTEGTNAVVEIDLADYADENGNVLFGGIVFYNGATHWSFSYDGNAATQACTVNYAALKEKEAPGLPLPDGYVSIYSIKPEDERAPLAIDGGASVQVLGPAQGWGESREYDFSNYKKLAFKINYAPEDAGHQMAIRFSVNGTGATLHLVTLPTEGTSVVEELYLEEYADEEGKVDFGGIVIYNGASHWSFSYDSLAATQPCTIDYIALEEKINLPMGWTSFYSIKPEDEKAPIAIDGGAAVQLAGPSDWGPATDYDLSDYAKMAFKITYDPADAGHQVAIRFNINGSVKLHPVTLPEEGTSVVEEIDLTQYADENGAAINGGIVFYNGASHWSFSYDGTPATEACTINYIALKKKLQFPEGYVSFYTTNINMDEDEKAPIAIEAGAAVQLAGPSDWGPARDYDLSGYDTLAFKINYVPEDAGHQVAIRFNINGSVQLHQVTLPEEGTSVVVGINIPQYADQDRNAILGGIVFYNGATHWSFSYDGEPATQACVISFIAVKEKTGIDIHEIPEGYVSLYSVTEEMELAPLEMAGGESYQLLGSPANWGSNMDYDLTNYDTLLVQIVFDSLDIGKEVAIRFSVDGWTNLYIIPLDTMPDGQTVVREKIYLPDYANFDGEVLMGGIVFYNGASHWSFSYDDPATHSAKIDFVAINELMVTGIDRRVVRMQDDPDPNDLVNVYSITGAVLRQSVKYSEATIGLKQGLYIVGRKKVFVAGPRY